MANEVKIPESITLRTIKNLCNGMAFEKALGTAIEDENKMIASMLDNVNGGLSERGNVVSEHIMNRMYIKCNS